MKVKVGYITRWRRAIFFTLVACIVVFGLVSTVCAKLIEAALVSNMVSVAPSKWRKSKMIKVTNDYDGRNEFCGYRHRYECRPVID